MNSEEALVEFDRQLSFIEVLFESKNQEWDVSRQFIFTMLYKKTAGYNYMTTARKHQISLEATPYYHCVSRCVRSGFLCGKDVHTKQNYEHRRGWLEKRIQYVSQMFAIDICAYAIMHNHYHLVVYINKVQAEQLSEQAVIDRWCSLHNKPLLIERY